ASLLVDLDGFPAAAPLAILGALAVFSMHRTVVLSGKEISFSPVTMVFMAAVVVFDHERTLAGAVLVGVAGGVFFPALRRRTWPWAVLNGANWACSVGAAVGVYALARSIATRALPISLIAWVATAAAFVAVNWLLLVGSYAVERHRAPREVFAELVTQL